MYPLNSQSYGRSARLLMATGVGHALVGLLLFHEPLAAIARHGFFNAIVPSIHPPTPQVDRMAAFWFVLFTPILFLLAQITQRAVANRDGAMLTIVGWYLLVLGVVGVTIIPISGFWILLGLGPLVFSDARHIRVSGDGAIGTRPLTNHT